MFKPDYGICIDCPKGTKSFIVVKAMRCAIHNYEFKQLNKSPEKLVREKLREKEKLIKARHYKFPARKVTGELTIFDKIWLTRLHKCEVCTRPIIRKKNEVGMFSHVLSKGASEVMRLDGDFILLMGDGRSPNCNCHRKWETRTKEMREIEMWKPIFLLLDAAKEIGHKRRKNKPLYTNSR